MLRFIHKIEQANAEGLEKGRVEGRVEGIEEERQRWQAWYTRQQEAIARGEDFTEPPPSQNR